MKQRKSILDRRCVLEQVMGKSKQDILKVMSDALEKEGYIRDRKTYDRDLAERERTYPTYIGHGIAIPHCLSLSVRDSGLCIAKLANPVHWSDAKEDSDTVFVLMIAGCAEDVHADEEHLKLLSRLSMMLMHPDFRKELLAGDSDEIYRQVIEVFGG